MRSRTVRSVGYDQATAVLELEYTSGDVYRYYLVPASVYEQLESAPSIGRFVNAVIKPRYRHQRVEHRTVDEDAS